MGTYFNEFFGVSASKVDKYGAFNISLINDLPLFIDPFLLFNSKKSEYQELHADILRYMVFLRDKTVAREINADLVKSWFMFPEVKQNWLGFSLNGNGGTGLGKEFADSLKENLRRLFSNFGEETVTKSSHVEKVCLVKDGVGRDNISDFTTNLLKDFICRYTEAFAVKNIDFSLRKTVWIKKAVFNYDTETWERRSYDLPYVNDDFVLLTPKDILTRDENWINRPDMIRGFEAIPPAITDAELRGQVFNYFNAVLSEKKANRRGEHKQKDKNEAAARTIMQFPQLLDYYIKLKENSGDDAVDISAEKVVDTEKQFKEPARALQLQLAEKTEFYKTGTSYEEAHARLAYLKDVIENKGGHRIFWKNGVALQRESDLQIIFRFVWYGTPYDVGTEANDGRGPVDYKIAFGAKDKTLVEMKLAKNTGLVKNLKNQLGIYQKASDAKHGIKVIMYFSADEKAKLDKVLKKLNLVGHKDVVLIDARSDNKPSGSKAK